MSTDKLKLNIEIIHDYLCNESYWAKGRSFDDVKKSIENSICFGVYHDDKDMVGFARVVSDQVVFAYLMDVFILKPHRGKGLGKKLVKIVMQHPELQVKFWLLGTVDAHGMYKKLGFSKLNHVERYMEIKDPNQF